MIATLKVFGFILLFFAICAGLLLAALYAAGDGW